MKYVIPEMEILKMEATDNKADDTPKEDEDNILKDDKKWGNIF